MTQPDDKPCPWCGWPMASPDSPHHGLCCADSYSPCPECKERRRQAAASLTPVDTRPEEI